MTKKRLWYGHLEDGNGGSIVIWDQELPQFSHEHVRLYHARRKQIVQYNKAIVKIKLRPLLKEELSFIDAITSEYFDECRPLYESFRDRYLTSSEGEGPGAQLYSLYQEIEKTNDLSEKKDLEKLAYDLHLQIFGEDCDKCDGLGSIIKGKSLLNCSACNGLGKV